MDLRNKFEYAKGVIRSRTSEDKKNNDQKNDKEINNGGQNNCTESS